MRAILLILMLTAFTACQSDSEPAAEQAKADSLITTLDSGDQSIQAASDSLDAALDSLDTIGE
jgi:hypothetical protein